MLLFILCAGLVHAADEPFWRAQDKFYARVKDGDVVVAANTREVEGHRRRLTVRGGGHVRAPAEFTYRFARQFDRVAGLSGYVERSEWTGERLKLTFAALGRRADLTLTIRAFDSERRLRVVVAGGPLDGFAADFTFTALDARTTEVAIDGALDSVSRIRGGAIGLGLEGVLRLMAIRLKAEVERAAKAVDKGRPGVEGSGA